MTEEAMSYENALYLALVVGATLLFAITLATVTAVEARRRKAGRR